MLLNLNIILYISFTATPYRCYSDGSRLFGGNVLYFGFGVGIGVGSDNSGNNTTWRERENMVSNGEMIGREK